MNEIEPQSFYNYFRGCYQLDYREFAVDNVLSVKYKHKWLVSEREELYTDSLPYIPYNNKKVFDLEKDIELYKLEKKLFYGCFFILGKSENPLIKDKRICAPLVLFPANIITIDDLKFLEIDRYNFVINRAILSKLELINESLTKDLFIQELSERIESTKDNAIWLKALLEKYFSNINPDELLLLPQVWSQAKTKNYLSKEELSYGEFKIVPSAGTVLVNKSETSLRVLNDLGAIALKNKFNSSLDELLYETGVKNKFNFSFLQSRLNEDQYQALLNAKNYNNSVLIGPPGTGKSYTITNIVADAVVNSKSVLVVSKTKQAVEVIRNMLQNDFRLKDYLIHTTGNKYKLSLQAKIRKYLSGIFAERNSFNSGIDINQEYYVLEELESKFLKIVEKELSLSDLEFAGDLSFVDKWRKVFLKYGLRDGEKLWRVFSEMNKLSQKLETAIKKHTKLQIERNISQNFKIFRKDISLFNDALEASNFTEYKAIIKNIDYRKILQVFPIWLANLSDLNSVLPLESDLFDLVIIDEATQCDIASALPAIYRAKSVLIAGDPNQLRHYSFVSRAQQRTLLEKNNLPFEKSFDYRNRSILDFYISKVTSQDQVTFLREHFRSTPSLIEFSNKQFYEGRLEVLKSTPKHTNSTQIELIEVKGSRNKKGVNEIEAKAVIDKLDSLLEKYKEGVEIPSIGIISLFSSQVEYVNKLLREKYDIKVLKKFNILCGTPYNFQGSEREIILLSLAVCDDTHHSAFIHANKPEVLNVAITRAKSFQYIFKSASASVLKQESLLSGYISFIKEFIHYGEENSAVDEFQADVIKRLKKAGYKDIKTGYPVAGSLLDLLVVHNNKNYFIDLIGYPGQYKEAFTIERYKTLMRTGIQTFPLHYSYWKKNKAEATKKLRMFLK